jgi:hypothetical protein
VNHDPNYKATLVLLDDFEAHGLVLFNKENFDQEYFKNFLEFQKAFTHSFGDLVGKLDPFENGYENSIIFAIYSESCFIVSHLDIMKTFLKIIINPQQIKGGFNDETTLGILSKKICNKMQYSEKLKNSIHGLFLEDFRTAIIHQNYLIHNNANLVIYPNDEKLKKHLNLEDLYDYALQVVAIFDAMIDWSNGSNTISEKPPTELDRIVDDFKKQVEALDRKLEKLS